MKSSSHKPVLRGTSYICSSCGEFLRDVRTSARLRTLQDVDPIRLDAVQRRYLFDPKLAKRLATEDLREVVSTYKFADKYNDFLKNPKARPDLQSPEAQEFLKALGRFHNEKTDALMPWLVREWKKGRIKLNPNGPGAQGNALQFDGGPEYEHNDVYGKPIRLHNLNPDTLNHWADWYKSDHPSRRGKDIMQMQSPEMHQTIKDWDAEMREKAKDEAQIRGDIVHSFPDGWTVQQLKDKQQLEDEGEAMGHCLGGYHPMVANGSSLIYSLRDHQNQPHATWEIRPRRHEGMKENPNTNDPWDGIPDGQLYPESENSSEFWTVPSPKGGHIVQIQGKGNQEPIPEYKQRIKDYFEKTMPNKDERPRADDEMYSDMQDLPYDGFNADNWTEEYGLPKSKVTFDWPSFIDNNMAEYSPGRGQEYDAGDLLDLAHRHGGLGKIKAEIAKRHPQWQDEIRDDFQKEWDENEPHRFDGWQQENPVNVEDYGTEAEYQKAAEVNEEEYHKYIQQVESEQYKQYWNEHPYGQWIQDWEDAMARHEREQRALAQSGESETLSKVARREGRTHTHWSTGQPCNCTFTDHLDPREFWARSAKIPTCEACGDPLVHGKCKRCDWSGWSTAIGDNEEIADPTKEIALSIQA